MVECHFVWSFIQRGASNAVKCRFPIKTRRSVMRLKVARLSTIAPNLLFCRTLSYLSPKNKMATHKLKHNIHLLTQKRNGLRYLKSLTHNTQPFLLCCDAVHGITTLSITTPRANVIKLIMSVIYGCS